MFAYGRNGGGGGSQLLTAKRELTDILAVKDGGGDHTQGITAKVALPQILGITSDSPQFDVVSGTRQEINKYIFDVGRIKFMLPHLNLGDDFSRPKHYNKNQK